MSVYMSVGSVITKMLATSRKSNEPIFFPPPAARPVANNRGQGLIEYLIIVALIAVATIGIMRVMGQAVGAKFATVSDALQGERRVYSVDRIDENLLRKRDLGDFMNGVGSREGGSRQ